MPKAATANQFTDVEGGSPAHSLDPTLESTFEAPMPSPEDGHSSTAFPYETRLCSMRDPAPHARAAAHRNADG